MLVVSEVQGQGLVHGPDARGETAGAIKKPAERREDAAGGAGTLGEGAAAGPARQLASGCSLTNAATGPTIRLDYGRDQSPGNPVASFMYFVPLISPEPVSSVTSPGSTQVARVLSAKRKSTPNSFVVTCEFEFAGNGTQQSVLDLEPNIRRAE